MLSERQDSLYFELIESGVRQFTFGSCPLVAQPLKLKAVSRRVDRSVKKERLFEAIDSRIQLGAIGSSRIEINVSRTN